MSKDRDIDDILESLNQLLREGESHNDDHVEPVDFPEKETVAVDDQGDFSDADEMDALLEGSDAEAADESSEDQPDIEPANEAEAVEQWQQDEPDGDEPDDEEDSFEEASVSDDGDEPLNLHRVVLTEDMLVDNPQRSLLSLVGKRSDDDDSDAASEASEPIVPQTEAAIDHALMAELLDRVTDDVIRQLPILIKTSLEQHLNEVLRDNRSGNATDQTEE